MTERLAGEVWGWLRGGNDEVGWDDLVRRIASAVAGLARFGARGRVTFPPAVEVEIAVRPGAIELVRAFSGRSDFDREVTAAIANRCDCPVAELPARAYRIAEGRRFALRVTEAAPSRWRVEIQGGDRAGQVFAVPPGRADIPFGRGEWHGSVRDGRNELVVCDRTEFVSRRAGRLHCHGSRVEVEALAQGEFLAVCRADGSVVHPVRTPAGRAAVGDGDAIELTDGRARDRAVRIIVWRG